LATTKRPALRSLQESHRFMKLTLKPSWQNRLRNQ
jgi:hypothetical protein